MPRGAATPSSTSSRRGAPPPALQRYHDKRDFTLTPEPPPARARAGKALSFVIQKHDARRLHCDFRLELDGVLLSWAVPKGPSFDPADKRMAVRTEDHPLAYAGFEGTIPAGQYGAGEVIVWDRGSWQPLGDPRQGLVDGKLAFELHGEKLRGQWELVRMRAKNDAPKDRRQEAWLLFKKRDAEARPRSAFDVISALPDSVNAKGETNGKASAPRAKMKSKATTTRGMAASRAASTADAAPKAALPKSLAPQLATLAAGVPLTGDWIYELKFDGYRLLARVQRGKARLYTRSGHDWSDRLPHLVHDIEQLGVGSAWLDGEIVVQNDEGAHDFNALQNAFERHSTRRVEYVLFDLPYFDGHDLRDAPLYARRALLERLLASRKSAHLHFSAEIGADGASVLRAACERHFEGVLAKRRDAPYRSARTDSWLKLKCRRRQEFVVGGYTDRGNAPSEIGSLLLGVHDGEGRLLHAGSVGTGWDRAAARALHARLSKLVRDETPFAQTLDAKEPRWPRRSAGAPRWVEPALVVEVRFGEWTPAGRIRHASFVAVRSDKAARAITREAAVMAPPPPAQRAVRSTAPTALHGIKISHPERVIDAKSGLTKLDLVRWYDNIADRILPHLQGRPVSLVRAHDGVAGAQFFQKHGEKIGIPGIVELPASLWPGRAALLELRTREALIGAAQMNVVEFHTWNSSVRQIGKPDRMIFDLDPGEGVAWPAIQEAALLVRALLEQVGLKAWLKTSGGKGLHVVVPLAARAEHDVVKGFSRALVQHLARTIPQRFVARSGPANRVGKIFVDYLRNGLGATTAVAFSARARPGLGVSMPLDWDALSALKASDQWTIANAREHLSFEKHDPWAGFASTRQSLGAAMKRLGYQPEARKHAA